MWIYKQDIEAKDGGCPQCGGCSYGARYVFGNDCYRAYVDQRFWLERKTSQYVTSKLYPILGKHHRAIEERRPKLLMSLGTRRNRV